MSRPGIKHGPPRWEASIIEKSHSNNLYCCHSEPLHYQRKANKSLTGILSILLATVRRLFLSLKGTFILAKVWRTWLFWWTVSGCETSLYSSRQLLILEVKITQREATDLPREHSGYLILTVHYSASLFIFII